MRWSPLSLALPFLLFTTSTIAYPVSDPTPSLSKIAKRTVACTGLPNKDLRRPKGKTQTAKRDCVAARTNLEKEGKLNTFVWPDADKLAPIGVLGNKKKGTRTPFDQTTIQFDPKTDGKVKGTRSTEVNGLICDHILELDFVGEILRQSNGVCEQIEAAEGADKVKKEDALDNIIATLNSDDNLALLLTSVESLKTKYTVDFKKTIPTRKFDDPPEPFTFLAMESYLELTQGRSVGVAQSIDAIITANFGKNAPTVTAEWEGYLRTAKRQSAAALKTLNDLKNAFSCEATPGASGSGSPSGSSPRRKVQRWIDSVLGRRARTGARTRPAATCTPAKSGTKKPPTNGPAKQNGTTKKPPTKQNGTTKKPPTKQNGTAKKPPTKGKTGTKKAPPTRGRTPPKSNTNTTKNTKKTGGRRL